LARDLEAQGEATFAAFAIDQLAVLMGSSMPKRQYRIVLSGFPMRAAPNSHALPGHADARGILAAPVVARLFFAGEVCSLHGFSTTHGAYRSGISAAVAVIAAMAKP
jgi:monoamine oxidase